MNEKINKNAKVENLTKKLGVGVRLIVIGLSLNILSPTVDRTVPKIPGKVQISLQGGGGGCKTAPMTSQRSYWRDVAIRNGVN